VTAWIIAIGRMLGLGSIAGIRPSLTLAVIGVISYFDWGVEANSTFHFLTFWLVIGIFVVLAILESAFDKISKMDRLQDRLIMPYRLAIGGVAGAATAPFGWQGVVVGAVLGVGAAWFSQYTKHISRPRSVPSEAVVALISAAEDLGAFLGSVLVLAVPYFGYACVGVTGFIYWRVGDRRRSKYKQMRRTARAAQRATVASASVGAGKPGPTAGPPLTPPAMPEPSPVEAAASSEPPAAEASAALSPDLPDPGAGATTAVKPNGGSAAGRPGGAGGGADER
jgi:uncharacterized membrane protein